MIVAATVATHTNRTDVQAASGCAMIRRVDMLCSVLASWVTMMQSGQHRRSGRRILDSALLHSMCGLMLQ